MPINTIDNLPQEVYEAVADEMLIPIPENPMVFWNLGPIERADPVFQRPGVVTALFNRPVLPPGVYTEVSRRLTDGTPLSTEAQTLSMTQTQLTIREYAGPTNASGDIRPFGVSEFLRNHSVHALVPWLGNMLARDYNKFKDKAVLDMLLSATNVVSPNGAAEGVITAGQGATVAWVRALRKRMVDLNIPTFPNGRWRLLLGTTDAAALKSDPEYREAMRQLGNQNPIFTGYIGSFEGFDIAEVNGIPTKGVGSGGAVTAQQSLAFGPYGIGWFPAMNPQPRQADDTDYGRQLKVLWKSEEALGLLYLDLLVRGITT